MVPPQTLSSSCPICQQGSIDKHWATTSELGDRFTFRLCSNCGSGYLDPQPTPAQLEVAYSVQYYGCGSTKFPSLVEHLRRFCARRTAKDLFSQLKKPSPVVLDVGCGDGSFLQLLHLQGAAIRHGMEPPGPAADRASKIPGLRLYQSTLAEVALNPESYDVVTARHVYEHLPNPLDSLDRLASLVRPGGLLFLSFPNVESWQANWFKGAWFHLDAPRHLHLPNPQALIIRLRSNSFKLIRLKHWSLEQNIYGWLQSALKLIDTRRNFFYETLKGKGSSASQAPRWRFMLHAMMAAFLLPPAFALDLLSVCFRRGATIQLTFQRLP